MCLLQSLLKTEREHVALISSLSCLKNGLPLKQLGNVKVNFHE